MFTTSIPVTDEAFHNRKKELQRLEQVVQQFQSGTPKWLAMVGPRKVGKTSLMLELASRARDSLTDFIVLDILETAPVTPEVFRTIALRVVDRLFGAETGGSLELLGTRPAEYRRLLQRSGGFLGLPADLRTQILEMPEVHMDPALVRQCLDLPEKLARALNRKLLVALDEFQELAVSTHVKKLLDPIPLMRSVWQRHRQVAYVISGSARRMLTEMVTSKHSPFFQHFELLEAGPFSRDDSVSLLTERGPENKPIPKAIAAQAVELLGGHPFYLQLFGEAVTTQPPPLDQQAFKAALQQLLFSRTGRLALFFENELNRLVGRSRFLSACLAALAPSPLSLTEVAGSIRAPSGATAGYLERLGDAVRHLEDGKYALSDPAFALWLQWRNPGGTLVPMTLIGDEAEKCVAAELAAMGFDLVYQSRASRGAFDLLATRGSSQLGVQVKRSSLPLRFSRAEWNRMEGDARRLGWRWIVASVSPKGEAAFLDPAKAAVGKQVRVSESSRIENLLLWLED